MAFKETVTAVVVKNAIKYARKDFDKNAPRILSLMEMADVKKVNRSTYALSLIHISEPTRRS